MGKINIELADRVKKLPPYLFVEMEKIVLQKKKEGVKFVSLAIGDPDIPPPPFILDALRKEVADPKNHNYSFSQGEPEFKQAVANWYKKRFKVDLNPETEVVALIGSKEGMANFFRAFVNPGDYVLVPDPSYPLYRDGGTLLSEGIPLQMPLLEHNDFKPNLDLMRKGVKLMFLNYPNNPTTAVIEKDFLEDVVEIAKENSVIVAYDNAYSEITFEDYQAPSILQVKDAMDVAIEFHSCSKTFNMTGDRIGFAVGNEKLIDGLVKVKSQIDSGPPPYIQKVAVKALESYNGDEPPEYMQRVNQIYRERRDILVKGLNSIGLKCKKSKGTFYVWADCGFDSMAFTLKMLNVGVVAAPGVGFGKYGATCIRFSLTRPNEEIEDACERMQKIS